MHAPNIFMTKSCRLWICDETEWREIKRLRPIKIYIWYTKWLPYSFGVTISTLKSKMVPQMTNYRKCQFVSFSFTECFYCYK